MHEAPGLRARKIVASALKCSLDAVEADAAVESMPQWDSMGHVTIILELESALGRPLSPEEIAGIGSVGDVTRLLERQAASA